MEIINRTHKDITQNTRVTLSDYLRVEKKEFYFSSGCNIHLGIIPGMFMHFINDDDRWLFYLNMDNDGFETLERKGKNSCLVINSSLSNLFFNRTRCSQGIKFPIIKTSAMINKCPVYEILINKSFNKN